MPKNSTNMPSVTDTAPGSHSWIDSTLGLGSWMKVASGGCSGSVFMVGLGSESAVGDGWLGSGAGNVLIIEANCKR